MKATDLEIRIDMISVDDFGPQSDEFRTQFIQELENSLMSTVTTTHVSSGSAIDVITVDKADPGVETGLGRLVADAVVSRLSS